MKTANIILACLILLAALAMGGYFVSERLAHERDLENYHIAYTELIARYAAEYALDPYLVTAIMRCESSNDPDAVSKKGAIGLMQIMPDTGAWIAHKLGLDDSYRQEQLFDPETNIRFACWYLDFLTRRLEGNRTAIIAAYNAVTRQDVMALAEEIFRWDQVSLSAVGQVRSVEEYKELLLG